MAALGVNSGVVTFNATSADSVCGPVKAASSALHFYVTPNAGSPVTLQESVDGTTWVTNYDYVNGSSSTGKYVAATGALKIAAVPGAFYRLVALNADFSSGTTGTAQIWGS